MPNLRFVPFTGLSIRARGPVESGQVHPRLFLVSSAHVFTGTKPDADSRPLGKPVQPAEVLGRQVDAPHARRFSPGHAGNGG